ncbi:MAG: hypothetical protein Q8Q14_15485 [Gemmatimonadales bacterium]|nr:hypothetical protein [Gemmatimonadales bacterium]
MASLTPTSTGSPRGASRGTTTATTRRAPARETKTVDGFNQDIIEVAEMTDKLETTVRALATRAGRGPKALALNALATDMWKLRAALMALKDGEVPNL